MQDSEVNSDSTCLLCCQEREIFILPKCNHKHICWRCCINMIREGKFGCPFCKTSVNEKEKIVFVTVEQMMTYSYDDVLKSFKLDLLKSSKNSNFFYSSAQVAQKIEYETSYNCPFAQCQQLFDSLNQLKKHLDIKHKRQYCDICLTNRKCIQSQQILYSQASYQRHIKEGEFSEHGDLILFHPTCSFCRQLFYDIDEFRRHLELVHEKCYVCHKSSEEFKYVYFKDYEQAKQHFRKSHFLCEISTCMATKFENVFVTEQALNQHVAIVHRKAKPNKTSQSVMNIVLGFNQAEKQSVFEWDKIGVNFAGIFQMVEKSSSSVKLQPVEHQDLKIDIRDFYPEQAKSAMNLSLNKIKEKIEDKMFQNKYKDVELFIDDVDFFRPLDMQPLTRMELERFLMGVFDKKLAEPIINKFFAGRQDFSSANQYFSFVRDKMRSFSKIAYFYAFPQLTRFYKNDNPHKQLMDEFYYESLRELKVKKPFIIHTKQRYSEIIQFMKYLIEKEIEQRDQDSTRTTKELDIEKYLNFMNDTSLTYYVKHQESIFYVSKQKMTNLYHMINKCKVQDFLKMNWLLKVGFSNDAYKIIWREFYYNEQFECYHPIKKLTVQELAYLYAYCIICLEAIFEKTLFKAHKEKPLPLFLTDVLGKIKRTSTHQRMQEIIETQNKFLKADHLTHYNKDKGIIVNVEDHPSLLDRNIDVVPFRSKPPDKKDDFPTMPAFGTVMPKAWNQHGGTNKKGGKNGVKPIEEYPSILSDMAKNKKNQKKAEEEQFPVFHYVGKKQKKDKTTGKGMTLNEAIGFTGPHFLSSNWNEETSLKNWQKREQDQKRRIKRHEEIQNETFNKPKVDQKPIQKPKVQETSNKKQHTKKFETKPETQQTPKPIVQEPMIFLVSKKTNKIDEEQEYFQQTKKKKNKEKKNEESEQKKLEPKKKVQQDENCGLFEKIEKESELVSKKNKPDQAKLQNLFESAKLSKNEEKQKIFSKTLYMPSSYVAFENGDFPQLEKKIGKNEINLKESPVKLQDVKPRQKVDQKNRKKKMADDTSSEDEKPVTHQKKAQKIVQEKKEEQEFASLVGRIQKQKQVKISMVNQIIQSAKVEQKPQNIIQVKKGRKGKKEIIQRVNLANLW